MRVSGFHSVPGLQSLQIRLKQGEVAVRERISRIYLFTIGLLFYVPCGGLLLLEPSILFEPMGVVLGSPMAIEEIRASHGGVWLVTGLFCLLAVWQRALIPPALIYLLVFNGGYASGRIYSFAGGGVAASDLYLLFAFDITLVMISTALLWSRNSSAV